MKPLVTIAAMRRLFVQEIAHALPFPVDRLEALKPIERYSNVNFVFQVRIWSLGKRMVLYLKNAREYLARSVRKPFDFVKVNVDPLRMRGEVRLMQYLYQLWGPDVVPAVYYFDERQGVMVMNDVGSGGKLLIDEFAQDHVHPSLGIVLGALLGTLHGSTYNISEDWCGSTRWRKSMRWYIEQRMTIGIRRFVPERSVRMFLTGTHRAATSIVWADPVYRNIIVKRNGLVSCVDFDHAHAYDPAHDVGILTAHWWWMTLHEKEQVRADARAFLRSFWPKYTKTLKGHRVSQKDCISIARRAHQWAGIYLLSRTDGNSGSSFQQWPDWEQRIRDRGLALFRQEP